MGFGLWSLILSLESLGFGDLSLGFGVWGVMKNLGQGLGVGRWGLGFRVQVLGPHPAYFNAKGLGRRVLDLRFGIQGSGFGV